MYHAHEMLQMRVCEQGNLRGIRKHGDVAPFKSLHPRAINQKPIPERRWNPKKSENVYRRQGVVEKSQHFFISLESFFVLE